MMLLVPLLLGTLAGIGGVVVVRSTRRVELASALGRLGRTASAGRAAQRRAARLGIASLVAGRFSTDRLTDLAVMDREPLAHATRKITGAVSGAAVGLALGLLWSLSSDLSPGVLAAGTAIGIGVGYLVPDHRLRTAAKHRRTDAVAALSAYLDLVNILLAGGAGLETALHAASEAGDGWTFEQLRSVLTRARTTRQSVWSCCSELGRRVGIQELVELSASVQLAGQHGARIAQSLSARAQSLRAHVLAGIEEQAQSSSERMGLPTVLLFVGFLFLLGYPAAQIILGSA